MTGREKKMVAGGAVIGAVILVATYGIAPLLRKWTELGRILEPKVRYVERLGERSKQQQELLDERKTLTAKLGFLLGPEALPPAATKQPGGAPKGNNNAMPREHASTRPPAKQTAPPPNQEATPRQTRSSANDTAVTSEGNSAAPPLPTKKPDQPTSSPGRPDSAEAGAQKKDGPSPGISLATHIERTAKASGFKIQQIAPANPATCWKGNADFRGVGHRIAFETNTAALIKFLYALEKGDRLVRVEQAEFRRDPQKGPNIKVVLRLAGYEIAEKQP